MMDIGSDPNNNAPLEKSYSLRPRAALKKDEDDTDPEESWRPRGRPKRRSKQKGLPLSKYRRKTANARERSRMREINDAFEVLRRALPHLGPRSDDLHEKTTKIMTLRLAMKYITALDSALRQADLDSDGESLISDTISREHSLTPSSLSEPSDIFDQLFVTSYFDESPPSAASSSCAISPFLECIKSSSLGNKCDSGASFLTTVSTSLNDPSREAPASRLGGLDGLPPLSSRCLHYELSSAPASSLPQVDTLYPLDIQDSVSTTSWKELDCIPSPPLDLDDIFIT